MKKYYKFMDGQYVESFLQGNIRLGNSNYYRLKAAVEDDNTIGDINEGVLITNTADYTDKNVSTKNFRIITVENFFMFSFSYGNLDDLKNNFPYNSYIEISDPESLFREIISTGEISGLGPAKNYFDLTGCGHRLVDYTGNEDNESINFPVQPLNQFMEKFNTTRKNNSYSSQSEYRMFFCKKRSDNDHHVHYSVKPPCDYLNVKIDNISSFLEDDVFISKTEKINKQGASRDVVGSLNVLKRIVEGLERKQKNEQDKKEFIKTSFKVLCDSYLVLRENGYAIGALDSEIIRFKDEVKNFFTFYIHLKEQYIPNIERHLKHNQVGT